MLLRASTIEGHRSHSRPTSSAHAMQRVSRAVTRAAPAASSHPQRHFGGITSEHLVTAGVVITAVGRLLEFGKLLVAELRPKQRGASNRKASSRSMRSVEEEHIYATTTSVSDDEEVIEEGPCLALATLPRLATPSAELLHLLPLLLEWAQQPWSDPVSSVDVASRALVAPLTLDKAIWVDSVLHRSLLPPSLPKPLLLLLLAPAIPGAPATSSTLIISSPQAIAHSASNKTALEDCGAVIRKQQRDQLRKAVGWRPKAQRQQQRRTTLSILLGVSNDTDGASVAATAAAVTRALRNNGAPSANSANTNGSNASKAYGGGAPDATTDKDASGGAGGSDQAGGAKYAKKKQWRPTKLSRRFKAAFEGLEFKGPKYGKGTKGCGAPKVAKGL